MTVMHLYDRATMARALTLDLDPQLHVLLSDRIGTLGKELIDFTEYLVVEAGDSEDEIIRNVGFSPLVNPIDKTRFPAASFHPWWDYLADHGGWFEMIITFGGSFASILLIADEPRVPDALQNLCRAFASNSLS